MKKIFILIGLVSFNCYAGGILLQAPFTEAKVIHQPAVTGQLMVPPLVAAGDFREAVASDCRGYQETVTKYASLLKKDELILLVTSPLPFSMKKNYEVELIFPATQEMDLSEQGKLILYLNAKRVELNFAEADLLKDALNPHDGVQIEESKAALKVKFSRRDLFCGFLGEKLALKLGSTAFWKLSLKTQQNIQMNLKLLIRELKPVLETEKGERLVAALAGRGIYMVTRSPEFQAEKKFATVDYIWSLLFQNEDSLLTTELWSYPLNEVYAQLQSVSVELKGTKGD